MKTVLLRIIIAFLIGLFLYNNCAANLYYPSSLCDKSCEDEGERDSDDLEFCINDGSRIVPETKITYYNSLKNNILGNNEIGGFTLCSETPGHMSTGVGIDRNDFFGPGGSGSGDQPSEAYILDFIPISQVYPCLSGLEPEDIILTITINSISLDPSFDGSCCETHFNGVFANLYVNCSSDGGPTDLCGVEGDGMLDSGIGACSPGGNNASYNGGANDLVVGTPSNFVTSCLESLIDSNDALGIDLIPNILYDDVNSSGCSCSPTTITDELIMIDFQISIEYFYCEDDLESLDCAPYSFNIPDEVCDSGGFVFLPSSSNEGVFGTWSTSNGTIQDDVFWDVSSLGGTTATATFTPTPGLCATAPFDIELQVDACCTADGGSFNNSVVNNPQTIDSPGGNYFALGLNNFFPNIPQEANQNPYLFLLVDPNGVIIDSDNDLNNIDFPENTTDMPIEYCIYGLSYKSSPGLGNIINGTTNINFGDPNVLTDGDGNPLLPAPDVDAACMNLTTNCATIIVEPAITCPEAGTDATLDLCTDSNTIVDFIDALEGEPDEGGVWTDDNSSGVDLSDPTVVDISGLVTGAYNFTYTFSADGTCDESSAVLTINIDNPPNAGMDNTIDICSANNTSINLFSSLMGTPDTNGTWDDTNGTGVDLTDPMNVDFIGVPTGSYLFVYTIVTDGECDSAGSILTINISATPNAGMDGSTAICEGGSSIVNLMMTLAGSPDMGGIWTENTASGVNLSDPTNVDFIGIAAGDYTFIYTVDGGQCDDAFATATVTIGEEPYAGVSNSVSVCNDGSILDFESILTAPDAGGVWSDDNGSGVNISNPTVVNFMDVTAGTYDFTYTIAASGTCPERSATITATVFDNPDAGEDGTATYCIGASTPIDLMTTLGGVPDMGGTWMDTNSSGADISDPTNVDFSSTPVGMYDFTYTVTGEQGICMDDVATVTVNVIDQPNFGMNMSVTICEGDVALLDFFDAISAGMGGVWTDTNASGADISNPSAVDLSMLDDGTYNFDYTITGTVECPGGSSNLEVIIVNAPNTGTANPTLMICDDNTDLIDLFDLIDGEETGGIWTETSATPSTIGSFNAALGTFDPSNQAAQSYSFEYSILATPPCNDASTNIEIIIDAVPDVNLGDDIMQCVGDGSIVLDAENTGASYLWTVNPDEGNNGSTTQTISIADNAIQTTITVDVTQNNCSASDDINITISNPPTFVENAKDCSADLSSYTVTFTSNGDMVTASEGNVTNNMDGTFTISEISNGTDISIAITNSTTNCESNFDIIAPNCGCNTVNPPMGMDVIICSDETIPPLTANADMGLEINWYDAPSNGTLLASNSTTFTPTSAGIYYAEALDPVTNCTSLLVPIELIINDVPTASESDKICSADLQTYSVTILTNGNAISSPEGTVLNNMDGTFTISDISSGVDFIINISVDVTGCDVDYSISAPDCSCNTVNPPVGMDVEICADVMIPTLEASADMGLEINWYDAEMGGMILASNSSTYTPTMAGIYFVEALDPVTNCTSGLIPVELIINDLPTFSEDLTECSADLLTYSTTISSDADMIISTEGTVTDNMDGTFTISGISSGTNINLTVTNSTTNCSQEFTVTAPDCSCNTVNPPVGMDVEICADAMIPTLEASADMGLEINWYDAPMGGVLLAPNTSTYTPTMAGTYYVEAVDPVTNCSSELIPIALTINDLPTFTEDLTECSADLSTYSTTITTDADNVSSTEGIVADNMDGTFTISDINSGTDVEITITNSTTSCSQIFTVSAPDCSCNVVNPPTGMNVEICANVMIPALEVNAEMGLEINWFEDNMGSNTLTTNSPTFTPTQEGIFYAQTLDPVTSCTSELVPIELIINDLPIANAGVNDTINCIETSVVLGFSTPSEDDFTFEWTGLSGFSSTEPNPEVDFGDTFTLVITDIETGCTSEPSEVTIIEENEAPVALITPDPSNVIDCTVSEIQLNAETENNTENVVYEWAFSVITTEGPTFNAISSGAYSLSVLDTLTGCSSSDVITITNNQDLPEIIVESFDNLDCDNMSVDLDASNSETSSTITSQWLDLDGNTLSTDAIFTTETPGTYIYESVDSDNGCVNTETLNVTQNINIPDVDAGSNQTLDCIDMTADLFGNSLNSDISVEWSPAENIVTTNTDLDATVNAAAWYYLTVTDNENGCTNIDSVFVNEPTLPSIGDILVDQPSCDEASFGTINVTNVSGGTIPYNYGINGNVLSPNPVFTGLSAGTYSIVVEDVNGCTSESSVLIEQPNTFALELGDDQEIELGDSILLNPVLSIPDTQVDTVIWTATEMISCLDCLMPWVTPSQNTVYSIFVQDINGCTNQDEIVIEVDRQIGVYFPNAFSPNADGVNDFFTVLTGNSVASVKSLNIYDRWGNQVYQALNFDPRTNMGWDGRLNNKDMDAAVFIYFAEVVYLDGSTRTFKGDVSLLR